MTKLITYLMVLVSTGALVHAAESPIRVLVYGENRGSNIVYHYTVFNNGKDKFNSFTVGSKYDAAANQIYPELGKLPAGWRYGEKGEVGVEILNDSGSFTQPEGWIPWVYGQQESGLHYLEWRLPNDDVNDSKWIKPGQTLSGFSVTVPKGEDPKRVHVPKKFWGNYVTGHFTVGLWSNREYLEIHGTIEKLDTTPPFLSVSAAPSILWPPNNKLVSVNVMISVRDDYDPFPEIKLESITANEVLADGDIAEAAFGTDDRQLKLASKRAGANQEGRIYTITYSATDASGNKATASATVTVPHDQEKK